MSQSAKLFIPSTLYRMLLAEAQASPHAEICGLCAGQNFTITRHISIPNIAPNPGVAYVMEPAALVRGMYAIYAQGEQLVALYHSHPTGLPIPSPTDIAQATYPDASYVILGGNTMQAWQIVTSSVRPVEIVVL